MGAPKFSRDTTRSDLLVRGDLIELAPADCWSDCQFHDCLFVGLGPALFVSCEFTSCNLPGQELPQVHYKDCVVHHDKGHDKGKFFK